MKIEIRWTWIEDIYGGINHINESFKIDEIKLFQSDTIIIETVSPFIPIHMLILLWHYIYTLESQRKICVFKWPPAVSHFIYHCWLQDFINTSEVDVWKLPDSVILPFF